MQRFVVALIVISLSLLSFKGLCFAEQAEARDLLFSTARVTTIKRQTKYLKPQKVAVKMVDFLKEKLGLTQILRNTRPRDGTALLSRYGYDLYRVVDPREEGTQDFRVRVGLKSLSSRPSGGVELVWTW